MKLFYLFTAVALAGPTGRNKRSSSLFTQFEIGSSWEADDDDRPRKQVPFNYVEANVENLF